MKRKFRAFLQGVLCILFVVLAVSVASGAETAPWPDSLPQFLDQYGTVVLLLDPGTGQILDANQAAALFYGYSQEQLRAMNIMQINTLGTDEVIGRLDDARTYQQNNFIFRHRLAGGELRTVEVRSYPVAYQGRDALLSTVVDVTAREMLSTSQWIAALLGGVLSLVLVIVLVMTARSRRRLRRVIDEAAQTNRQLQTFINAPGDLVYLKDERLRYMYVSETCATFYNRTPQEMVGLEDTDLSVPAFAALRRQTDLEALEKGGVVHNQTIWEGRVYQTTKFPVPVGDGRMGVGAYIREITGEYKAERQRRQVTQRLTVMADMLSKRFPSQHEQLSYLLEEMLKLTESRYGFVYLYNEKTEEFILNTWSREVMEACRLQPSSTSSPCPLHTAGAWAESVRQRKPIVINDFDLPSPLKRGYPEGHVTITRLLTMPVTVDNAIVAVVGLANKQEPYDDNDVYELTLMTTGIWNDLQRQDAEAKLAIERSRYRQTLISIGDAVMVIGPDRQVEMLNMVAEKLTGWSAADAIGRQYTEIFTTRRENTDTPATDPVALTFATGEIQSLSNHTQLLSKTGARYYIEDCVAPIRNGEGAMEGAVLVFRDVSNQKLQLQQIEYLSFHDALTGLFNRRFFNEELKRLDTPRNWPLTIVMGDVNGLKLTNDVFGHAAGDRLLERVSKAFQRCCRADDIIARWGGDEFVILLPHTGSEDAGRVIGRIEREVAKEKAEAFQGSIALGQASKTGPDPEIAKVLTLAEEAMYGVKLMSRDKYQKKALQEIIGTVFHNSAWEHEHSKAVSRLSERLGQALGLPEEDIKRLRDAGYYHDIGKVIMAPQLLDDSRTLTDAEWKEFRLHPTVGYRILNCFDQTVNLAEIVLAHHERWDGGGYPKGLRGEEIPLLARVVAVAEHYDRIIRRRQENGPVTILEALRELDIGKGSFLEPRLVDAFTLMLSGTPGEG